jgi:hypothetical protein
MLGICTCAEEEPLLYSRAYRTSVDIITPKSQRSQHLSQTYLRVIRPIHKFHLHYYAFSSKAPLKSVSMSGVYLQLLGLPGEPMGSQNTRSGQSASAPRDPRYRIADLNSCRSEPRLKLFHVVSKMGSHASCAGALYSGQNFCTLNSKAY